MYHSCIAVCFSLVEGPGLCVLLDEGMADVVCKAVQTEQGLKDDIHVASVTQVCKPGEEHGEEKR